MAGFSIFEWSEVVAALLVALGCLGELALLLYKAPRPDQGEKRLHGYESRKRILEWVFVSMVAIGVTVELIELPIGLKESIRLKSELERTSSNTPPKMKVRSISASATLMLGTNYVARGRKIARDAEFHGWTAILHFGSTNDLKIGGTNGYPELPSLSFPVLSMCSDELFLWGGDPLTIPLQFRLQPGMECFPASALDEPAEKLIQELNAFLLDPAFLQNDTEILGGTVTLVLNGSVSKVFPIPAQKYFMFHSNAVTGRIESHPLIHNLWSKREN